MEIALIRIEKQEKSVLISLFNYYMYEFSDILKSKLHEDGSYPWNSALIDPYWQQHDHIPYFIKVDGEIAGFVLIRNFPGEEDVFDIDQFFVLKRFSRLGVGSLAFRRCLELYPGKWLVRVLKENERGLKFWQRTISSITDGNFTHGFELDLGVEMHFFRFIVDS